MIKRKIQGDIFSKSRKHKIEFILVFGSLDYQCMYAYWEVFSQDFPALKSIKDPFRELSVTLEYAPGRWLQCVRGGVDHGMREKSLGIIFKSAFQWAMNKGITRVSTNGIRDVGQRDDDLFNSASNKIRREFIENGCKGAVYDTLEISLIGDLFNKKR